MVGLLEGIVPEDHPIKEIRGSAVFVEGPDINRYDAMKCETANVNTFFMRRIFFPCDWNMLVCTNFGVGTF